MAYEFNEEIEITCKTPGETVPVNRFDLQNGLLAVFMERLEERLSEYPDFRVCWDNIELDEELQGICNVGIEIDRTALPMIEEVLHPTNIGTTESTVRLSHRATGTVVLDGQQAVADIMHPKTYVKTLNNGHMLGVIIPACNFAIDALTKLNLPSTLTDVDATELITAINSEDNDALSAILTSPNSADQILNALTRIKAVFYMQNSIIQSYKQLKFNKSEFSAYAKDNGNLEPDIVILVYMQMNSLQKQLLTILKSWYRGINFPTVDTRTSPEA